MSQTTTFVPLKFTSDIKTNHGEAVYVTGSIPALGSWNPSKALRLEFNEEGKWSKEFEIGIATNFEYKFFVSAYNFQEDYVRWGEGPNLQMRIPARSGLSHSYLAEQSKEDSVNNSENASSLQYALINTKNEEDKNYPDIYDHEKNTLESEKSSEDRLTGSKSASSTPYVQISTKKEEYKDSGEINCDKEETSGQNKSVESSLFQLRMRVAHAINNGLEESVQSEDDGFYSLYFPTKLRSITDGYVSEYLAKRSSEKSRLGKNMDETQESSKNEMKERILQELCEQIFQLKSFQELILLMLNRRKESKYEKVKDMLLRDFAKKQISRNLEDSYAYFIEEKV